MISDNRRKNISVAFAILTISLLLGLLPLTATAAPRLLLQQALRSTSSDNLRDDLTSAFTVIDQSQAASLARSSAKFQTEAQGHDIKFHSVFLAWSSSPSLTINSVNVVYYYDNPDGTTKTIVTTLNSAATQVIDVKTQDSFRAGPPGNSSSTAPRQQPIRPLSASSVNIQLMIVSNPTTDTYTRSHGLSVDRSLPNPWWYPYQSGYEFRQDGSAFTYTTTLSLSPGNHYVQEAASGLIPNYAWHTKIYVQGVLTAEGDVGRDHPLQANFNVQCYSPVNQNIIWAGYALQAACQPSGYPVYEAHSIWHIPSAGEPWPHACEWYHCDVSIWPGISDAPGGSQYIAQLGSNSGVYCGFGSCGYYYKMWYEFWPDPSADCSGVAAGDQINADVWNGALSGGSSQNWYFMISDDNGGYGCFTIIAKNYNTPAYGQFIAERPHWCIGINCVSGNYDARLPTFSSFTMTAVLNQRNPSLTVTGSTAYNNGWYWKWYMQQCNPPCIPNITASAIDGTSTFTFNYGTSSGT